MSVRHFLSSLSMGASLIALSTVAANAQDTVQIADDVIVSANRIATPLENIGSSVTLITAEDIEQSQARTVADALRSVPGLTLTRTGGFGGQTSVRIRGMEGYQSLLLIDGVEVADLSGTQQTYDFAHLTTNNIERIEILRGAQSTLYGADAIGGVINIITKRGSGTPEVTAAAEFGSFQTKDYKTGVRGSEGRFDYALNAHYINTHGYSAGDERNGNDETDGYENRTFNGRFGLQATDDLRLESVIRHVRAHYDYDSFSQTDSNDNDIRRENSIGLTALWDTLNDQLTHKFGVSYAKSQRDRYQGNSRRNSFGIYDGRKTKFDYQGTYKISPTDNVIFGAETERDHTKQSGLTAQTNTVSGYASYQFEPVQNLNLSVGLRHDDHSGFDDYTTYRATASYVLDRTSTRFHSSIGTGFRAPSLYELYAVGSSFSGNADLEPEESRSIDFGVEQPFWDDRLIVDVTGFSNKTKNLIIFSNNTYENINRAKSYGVETSASLEVNDALFLTGTYTYQIAKDEKTNVRLSRRAKHEGNIGINWQVNNALSADFNARARSHALDTGAFADNAPLGGYAVFDAKLSYDVNDDVRLYGRVENLLDKEYQEVSKFGMPGRAVYVGINATF